MKIVFLSGVKFGLEILNHIIENNFNISHVFSYDESKKFFYSDYVSFENTCKKFGISNTKIKNINDSQNIEILKSIKPDLILVMGWSQLLTDDIISIPKLGVIGSHPTELPKYRGRAPIPWTILKNLKERSKEKTTLIVSHRISSIKDANCILVIDQGAVIERGTHAELINKGGFYKELFKKQNTERHQ